MTLLPADRLQRQLTAMVHMLKVCPYDGAKVYMWSKAKNLAHEEPDVYGELPRLLENAMKEND